MKCRIGHLTLDPDQFELTSRDGSVAIEPLVFELLDFLIENRDRVVSKDELFDSLWADQHVSESALTRCVYAARKALGDDAKQQVMIKTVYGRGYRFVGPVEPILSEPEGIAPMADPTAPSDARAELAAGESTGVKRRHPTRIRWVGAGIAVVVLSLFVLRPSHPEKEPNQALRLAVLPFQPPSGQTPQARLALTSLRDQLAIRFGLLPGVIVRSPELHPEDEADPARTMMSAQVDAVLTGSVRPTNARGRLVVHPELFMASPHGSFRRLELGAYEIDDLTDHGSLGRFLEVREAIAEDLAEHLAPALSPGTSKGLLPDDIDALTFYLEARTRFFDISCGEAPLLIDLLDRSLERDPEFSLAWALKAQALFSQAWACGDHDRYAQQALAAIDHALTITPRLPEASLLRAALLTERGQAESAYAWLVDRIRPRSPGDQLAVAYVLRYAGFLNAARDSTEAAIRLDPLALHETASAPLAHLYTGKIDRFLDLTPAVAMPYYLFNRAQALQRSGRIAEAIDTASSSYQLNPTDIFGRLSEVLNRILEGHDTQALQSLREIVRQRNDLGTLDGEMTFREAILLAFAGSDEDALSRLADAVDEGFFCVRCIESEPAFASLHSSRGWRAVILQATRRHLAFADRFSLEPELPPYPAGALGSTPGSRAH